mmetsp:Transcript_10344/g.38388  ORF Transcript_10344/g.38388 Transcript_10344/m.38388 type:complete len:304 (+) Transcript_10344:1691-2602(+)
MHIKWKRVPSLYRNWAGSRRGRGKGRFPFRAARGRRHGRFWRVFDFNRVRCVVDDHFSKMDVFPFPRPTRVRVVIRVAFVFWIFQRRRLPFNTPWRCGTAGGRFVQRVIHRVIHRNDAVFRRRQLNQRGVGVDAGGDERLLDPRRQCNQGLFVFVIIPVRIQHHQCLPRAYGNDSCRIHRGCQRGVRRRGSRLGGRETRRRTRVVVAHRERLQVVARVDENHAQDCVLFVFCFRLELHTRVILSFIVCLRRRDFWNLGVALCVVVFGDAIRLARLDFHALGRTLHFLGWPCERKLCDSPLSRL